MADWDDEDFEPGVATSESKTDKWEGEDEDDEVKDNWDDDEETEKKPDEEKQTEVAPQKKKKRSLKEVLKEKEEQKKIEQEKRAEKMKNMDEEDDDEELTVEEQMAEKLRRQRLVEEADLLVAVDLFGGAAEEPSGTNLDTMKPTTKQEFMDYSKLLVQKLEEFQSNSEFIPFLEETLRDICVSLEPDDIKRLASTLSMLQSEKLKAQKVKKGKKAGKKATLTGAAKMGKKDELDSYDYGGLGNEFDDFM